MKTSILPAPAWVYRIAIALFLLQLIDAWTTLHLLGTGMFIELNPVMAWCLHQSPLLFILAKMFMATVCAWWPPNFWRRTQGLVQLFLGVCLWALFIEYSVAVAHNLWFVATWQGPR